RALRPETPDDLARVVRSCVVGLRGHMRLIAGDLEQVFDLLQHTMALLPTATTSPTARILTDVRRAAVGVLGAATAYKLTGDVTASSERRAAEAIAPVRSLGNLSTTINGYTYLAYLQMLQGRLRAAAATYAEVERLIPERETLQTL